MAKNRYINTRFWADNYIVDCSPQEKLLFIYLLTNHETSICGIYETSVRRMMFDTGLEKTEILDALKKFDEDKKIFFRDGWIVLKNFVKHQALNPKIVSGIRNELSKLPKNLISLVDFDFEPKSAVSRIKVTPAQRKHILERDNHTCQFCGVKENLEIDHIKPVVLGGDNSDENLRVLCQKCNGKRNAELRWTINGEVILENSLPIKMGGLSHLNLNSNLNSNLNFNNEVNNPSLPPQKAANEKKKGSRIPKDFYPSEKMIAYAREKVPNIDLETRITEFRNYWEAKSGKDATKLDWNLTFQNRIIQIAEYQSKTGGANGSNQRSAKSNSKRTNADVIAESADFYANYPA